MIRRKRKWKKNNKRFINGKIAHTRRMDFVLLLFLGHPLHPSPALNVALSRAHTHTPQHILGKRLSVYLDLFAERLFCHSVRSLCSLFIALACGRLSRLRAYIYGCACEPLCVCVCVSWAVPCAYEKRSVFEFIEKCFCFHVCLCSCVIFLLYEFNS